MSTTQGWATGWSTGPVKRARERPSPEEPVQDPLAHAYVPLCLARPPGCSLGSHQPPGPRHPYSCRHLLPVWSEGHDQDVRAVVNDTQCRSAGGVCESTVGPEEVPRPVPCQEDNGASLRAEAGIACSLDFVADLPQPYFMHQVRTHEVDLAGREWAAGRHLEGWKHPHGLPCNGLRGLAIYEPIWPRQGFVLITSLWSQ